MKTLLSMIYLCGLSWMFVLPMAGISWFFTRKKITWAIYDLIALFCPFLWIAMNFYIPLGKSLSNVFAEPVYLGLGLSVLYLVVFFIPKGGSLAKNLLLRVAPIFLTLAIYFFVPILSE